MAGPTQSARFSGSVQGVVVQAVRVQGGVAQVRTDPLCPLGHTQTHGDRGILYVLVVAIRLEVGERRRELPRVGHDAVALVDAILVPELLEDPPHRLHEVDVHRLVVVIEVDPAPHSGDRLPPFRDVGLHHLATLLVEDVDPALENLARAGEAERLLRKRFDRQPVTIPTESPLDVMPPHAPVAGNDVLDRAGEEVAIMRRTRREGWPVIEDECRPIATTTVALGERVRLVPEREDLSLHLREIRAGVDAFEDGLGWRTHHDLDFGLGHPIRRPARPEYGVKWPGSQSPCPPAESIC